MYESGFSLTGSSELLYLLDDVKRQVCYVADSYEEAVKQCAAVSPERNRRYMLPDGEYLTLNREAFLVGEQLFRPAPEIIRDCQDAHSGSSTAQLNIGQLSSPIGVHEMVLTSVKHCDSGLQRDLLQKVMLCGGSSQFPGLPERLDKEMRALPSDTIFTGDIVVPPDRRQNSCYLLIFSCFDLFYKYNSFCSPYHC